MIIHKTKEGKGIPLSEIKDSHLVNILKWHIKNAKNGVRRQVGFSCFGSDNMDRDFDEQIIGGLDYLKECEFKDYYTEALSRISIAEKAEHLVISNLIHILLTDFSGELL